MGKRTRRGSMSDINVVPYIDVMLVLLVIFMITAPMLTQGVKVELPQADAEQVKDEALPPLVVTVDADGNYYLEYGTQKPVLLEHEALTNKVGAVIQAEPKTPVYVKGDRNVAYGKVVGAMVVLQQAGVPNVGMLTDPVEQ